MKVSVLIPVYQVESLIERCARSVFEQTYEDLDIIFVDDCSPDNSVNIIKRTLLDYPNRICQCRVISHDVNKGLAEARNTAVANARGEYLYHLDGDDFIVHDIISQMYDFALKTNADIVFANYAEYFSPDKVIERKFKYSDNKRDLVYRLITGRCHPYIWNKLIRTKLYHSYNVTVPSGVNYGEDHITIPRLVFHSNKVTYLNVVGYFYEQKNQNSFQTNFNTKFLDQFFIGLKFLKGFFEINDRSYVKYVCAEELRMRLKYMYYSKNISEIRIARNIDVKSKYFYLISTKCKFFPIYIADSIGNDRFCYEVSMFTANSASKFRILKHKICDLKHRFISRG